MKHNVLKKRIRTIALCNLIIPVIIVLLTLVVAHFLPVTKVNNHVHINKLAEIPQVYADGEEYIEYTIDHLYHTGQEHIVNGQSFGQYYYVLEDDACYFFLLSHDYLDKLEEEYEDLNVINNITIQGSIVSDEKARSVLVSIIARELNWSHSGLDSISCEYLVNERNFDYLKGNIITFILLALALICLILIIYNMICLVFPCLYAPVFKLRKYGSVNLQLCEAEEELHSDVTLEQGDFVITKNYIINFSNRDLILVPINKIVWAYRFSSYHLYRIKNRKITFTLCILCKHNLFFKSSRLQKADTNAVLLYLNTYYPEVLIGYSKTHEKTASARAKSA